MSACDVTANVRDRGVRPRFGAVRDRSGDLFVVSALLHGPPDEHRERVAPEHRDGGHQRTNLNADVFATAGNSFGGMSGGVDGAVNTHLSSYTPCEYVQDRVKAAIVEQFAGELPVGAAVVVATAHPRHTTLIYAPTMRVPGPLPEDTIVPYLAFRAVLVALKRSGMRSVSTPLFGTGAGEVPVAKACRQMLRAAASVEACGRTMLQPNELFSMHRDHRELLAL